MFGIKKEKAYPLVGAAAALFLIPIVELALSNKQLIPSYSIFLIILGGIIGAVYSLFFSIMRGLNLGDSKTALLQGVQGLLIGFIGGAAGFFCGQLLLSLVESALYNLDRDIHMIVINITKLVSWIIIGFFIGFSEGFRNFNLRAALISAVGGVLGGFIGGLVIVLSFNLLPPLLLRVLIFLVVGISIGLFINIIKARFTNLELTVLNGPLFGKSFAVLEKDYLIGRKESCALILKGYRGISRLHARIKQLDDEHYKIEDLDSTNGLFVNDKRQKERTLKDGDTLRLGTTRLLVKMGEKK